MINTTGRTERIDLRVSPEMKDAIVQRALEENLTIARYIENLILKDIKRAEEK